MTMYKFTVACPHCNAIRDEILCACCERPFAVIIDTENPKPPYDATAGIASTVEFGQPTVTQAPPHKPS